MRTHLDTDVLVVGGGAAGANTALTAHALGLKVLLCVKGVLGRSGASIFAGNLTIPPGDRNRVAPTPEQRARWMDARAKHLGSYLVDQDYILRASAYAADELFPELERKGLYIRRLEDGSLLRSFSSPDITYTWAPKQGQSGTSIMDLRRKEVLAAGIPVLEETMVTSLLTRDGRVVGATAVDILDGRFRVIRAKAVVLATGQSHYLATRATGTREQCANGFAAAYRAGATLQNMEMQWWHVSDVARPQAWMRLHVYPNPMPATSEVTRLYNSDHQFFFSQTMYPLAFTCYYLQMKHLIREVRRGKARLDGGFYSSYRHIDPRVVREYSLQSGFYEKVGLDPARDLIECAVTWHMTQGGLVLNTETMETSVPGLLAAGSVGSHFVGSISFVHYDGKVAAHTAARSIAARRPPELDEDQIGREEQRVLGYLRTQPADGLLPAQVKRQIRAVMWEKMGPIKNQARMEEALAELTRIRREDLPRMRLGSDTPSFNYDWIDALDVEDMLLVCELAIRASLYRKESRGPFYREDYPFIDNERWLNNVVLARTEAEGLEISTTPVKLPYARPQKMREDYLSADY